MHVHQRVARQAFSKGAKQQALALHGQEVLTVDPHQVHAATGLAGGLLGPHPLDHVSGVADLDMLQPHPIALLHLACHPLDVAVDHV